MKDGISVFPYGLPSRLPRGILILLLKMVEELCSSLRVMQIN